MLILPCLWLVAAVALSALRSRRLATAIALGLVAVPLAANVVTVSAERRLDRQTLERSAAVTALLGQGDLLIYPGHTWDEYIGFYEDAPVERFILASFAGEERGDREAFLDRFRERIEAAHREGRRVLAVRVLDPPDGHHGWSLLGAMGIPRDDVLILLADYGARRLISRPVGVWQVLPAPGGSPPDEVALRSSR